jgi:hypothetical protein
MVSVWDFFFRICRTPESTRRPAHFTQSTTYIVVPHTTIEDIIGIIYLEELASFSMVNVVFI